MKRKLEILIAGLLGVTIIVGSLLYNQPPQEKYVKVVDKVMASVVEIRVIGDMNIGVVSTMKRTSTIRQVGVLGSGVFVSTNGYILTVAHLFNNFDKIHGISIMTPSGDVVAGKLKDVSKTVDLALIKVDYFKYTPSVVIADPRELKIGQEVIAIGSPAGLSFSVSNGIISALYRDFQFAYNVTQSNTAINPGNSGGPLFNLKGELVGINSFYIFVNAYFPVFTGLGFSVQSGQCSEYLMRNRTKFKDLKTENAWDGLKSALGVNYGE